MTNGWTDIRNTDVVLAMGGNPAENHPCGFKWVIEAKKKRRVSTAWRISPPRNAMSVPERRGT